MGTSLVAEPLLSLAVKVTSEQHVDAVLKSIVQGLASQPGVALARIWLLPTSTLYRIPQIIFVSSQAPEPPSTHRAKIGLSCMGNLLEYRSMLGRLVK